MIKDRSLVNGRASKILTIPEIELCEFVLHANNTLHRTASTFLSNIKLSQAVATNVFFNEFSRFQRMNYFKISRVTFLKLLQALSHHGKKRDRPPIRKVESERRENNSQDQDYTDHASRMIDAEKESVETR